MKIQIIGKITGDPDYKRKFDCVAKYLRESGQEVFNPAELPSGWPYEDYMERCLRELEEQDGICRLENWQESPGARRENEKARRLGLDVLQAELVPFGDLYMVRVYVPAE